MTEHEYNKTRRMFAPDVEEAESLTPEVGERFWEVVNSGFHYDREELAEFLRMSKAIVVEMEG